MKKIIYNVYNKYKVFIKYVLSAGISFIVDIFLFSIFSYLLKIYISSFAIIVSTVIARCISSFINYLLNGNVVFKSNDKVVEKNTVFKYYTLVVIQLCVSAVSVYLLYLILNVNETLIKVPVDVIIFMINYVVQKKFIFIKKGEK